MDIDEYEYLGKDIKQYKNMPGRLYQLNNSVTFSSLSSADTGSIILNLKLFLFYTTLLMSWYDDI